MVYSEIRLHRALAKHGESIRFVVVGIIGFGVNFIVLLLLHGWLGVGLVISQLAGGELALISSFTFHSNWTYREYVTQPLWRRLLAYHTTAWFGVLLNLILLLGFVQMVHINYLVAITISALIVMGWNFILNRMVIWRRTQLKDDRPVAISEA